MNGSLILTGKVLSVEHRRGEFEGRPYDFHTAEILAGRRVVEVRFRNDTPDARPPREGDDVTLELDWQKGRPLTAIRYAGPAAAVKSA